MEEHKLSITEAYVAVYIYLQKIYEMTHSSDLGGLLGTMSFLPNGEPVDQANWEDWLDSTNEAIGQSPKEVCLLNLGN